MHVTDSYVVVNKPAGVPVVPSVDNILESCLACAAQVHSLSASVGYCDLLIHQAFALQPK